MSNILSELQLTELFNNLGMLPARQGYSPTFLAMAGFPHRETVWSNILEFYFQSANGHGLGNTVFRAFMALMDVDVSPDVVVEARREVSIENSKRLDLVLETSEMVVGIENKVDHDLINPLDDYRGHLIGLANGRTVYVFVLSLYSIDDAKLYPNWHFVTYDLFCAKLSRDERIGSKTAQLNNKYVMFLNDFIASIKQPHQGEYMDAERLTFYKKNLSETELLLGEVVSFKEELDRKVRSIKSLFDRDTLLVSHKSEGKMWTSEKWPTHTLSYRLTIAPDIEITFSILIGASSWIPGTVGWALLVHNSDEKPQNRIWLKQRFDSRQIQYFDKLTPWRLRIEDPSTPLYDDDIELVSRWALDWLNKVVS